MEGAFLVIFIFVGVIAITALVFGAWVVMSIVSLVFRVIGYAIGLGDRSARVQRLPRAVSAVRGRVCPNESCQAVSPENARYCRRCGREFGHVQRVATRRAAVL